MTLLMAYIIDIIGLIIVIYVIYYINDFYSHLKLYPNGPKPIPLFGNMLMLIGNLNRHPSYFLADLAHQFGDIYTFWLFSKPIIIISSEQIAKQAFNYNDCSDRFDSSVESLLNSTLLAGHKSFAFSNFNDECKISRKVSAEALRKYLSSNNLSEISCEIVDETVERLKSNEKENDFNASEYIDNIFIRIAIRSTFGKHCDFDSDLIQKVLLCFNNIQNNLVIVVAEFFPIFKYFIGTKKQMPVVKDTIDLFDNWYKENKNDNRNENMCVCIKLSESINSNKIDLNDESIVDLLVSIFIGSSDTTHIEFKWILLFVCHHQEMQQRMRDEINSILGKRKPEAKHKEECDFVMAFISETFRFRNILPMGVFHHTQKQTEIADKSIPKGTTVFINQQSILNDRRYWQNPDTFNPQRFLDCNQRLIYPKNCAFIPFSVGKRMCIGDKFAVEIIFLILSRLLQATDGSKFILSDKHYVDFEPKVFSYFFETKDFKVRLVKQ